MKIDSGTATLIGATLAFLGVIGASTSAQMGAADLEDRRGRTEIVIELMKANNREETIQKLHILSASGLLPDKDGKLLDAVAAAPPVAFKLQEVKIPIPVRCVEPKDIPLPIAPLRERWPQKGNIAQEVARMGIQGLELRNQNDLFRALLIACTGDLPSADEVEQEDAKPVVEANDGANDRTGQQ